MPKELVDFLTVLLNGVTLAALYFIVASGFTLIFGLMRTTNMAHGSMYVLGAYVGVSVVREMGAPWLVGVAAAFVIVALVGIVIHLGLLARMAGQDLRQALVTIGVAIIIADLALAHYGGIAYQIPPPSWADGSVDIPWVVGGKYSAYRLWTIVFAVAVGAALWLILNRTRIGMYIRAGIDDRDMLSALGVNVSRVFLVVFALGAGLAGLSGVIGDDRPVDHAERGRPLPALVARRRDRRRDGQPGRRGDRRPDHRPGGAGRPLLRADLLHLPDLRDHGRRPGRATPGSPRATGMTWLRSRQGLLTFAGVAALVVYPLVMPRFWVLSIGSSALILGIVALSLIFMAGYGGMVSLAQAALAGFAAYVVALAYLVPSTTGERLGRRVRASRHPRRP